MRQHRHAVRDKKETFMKQKTKFLTLIWVLFATVGFGQNLLQIEDAFALALKKNHDILVARNDAQISKNNVHIGNAGLLPQIDLISNANYQKNTRKTDAGNLEDVSTQTVAKIQASYTLFDGFNNIYSFKRFQTFGELGELQARNNIENTLIRVSNAYYAVAGAQENFDIAQEALTISRERFARARKRSQYGQANTIDVLSAQVDLNADSVSLFNAGLRLDKTRRDLNFLLNRNVNAAFTVNSEVVFFEIPDRVTLKEKAFQNNALYLLSVNNLEKSKLDLKIAQASFFPRLALTTSYGYNQVAPDLDIVLDNPNSSLTAGVTLSLNLFNGFKNSIQQQNAKIEMKSRELLRQQARLQLESEIDNLYESYENSRHVLEIQQKNLKSAELNFRRTSELYGLGQVTTTTFREAQLNLIRARNSITNAKFDAKLFQFQLLQLSGLLLQETGPGSD